MGGSPSYRVQIKFNFHITQVWQFSWNWLATSRQTLPLMSFYPPVKFHIRSGKMKVSETLRQLKAFQILCSYPILLWITFEYCWQDLHTEHIKSSTLRFHFGSTVPLHSFNRSWLHFGTVIRPPACTTLHWLSSYESWSLPSGGSQAVFLLLRCGNFPEI